MKYRGPKKGNLQNGFIVALGCSVGLAFLFPGPGAKGGWLHPDLLNNAGIALILFLQGLAMAVERMKSGAGNWRLHLIIQSFTFVLFPAVGLAFLEITRLVWPSEPSAVRDGFLYLGVLPSTVSTSVVLTAVARGNTSGAVFNPKCLGISAICEFGRSDSEISAISDAAGHRLLSLLERCLSEAKAAGEIAQDVAISDAASFIVATLVGH